MIIKLTTGLLVLAILVSSFSGVSAERAESTIDVHYESVNPPDGLSYLFKRIGEKISMFLAFSNKSKISSYKKLVTIRLAELKFVIENKQMGYFEKSTQRYFTTAGQLTELLTSTNIESEFIPVKEELSSHIPVLTALRDTYDSATAEWRFVEDDINYIKGYINNLSMK